MIEPSNKVTIECETKGFEETTAKIEALADAYDGFPPQVQLKGCNHCTINIHPSQTRMVDYHLGGKDGHDQGSEE